MIYAVIAVCNLSDMHEEALNKSLCHVLIIIQEIKLTTDVFTNSHDYISLTLCLCCGSCEPRQGLYCGWQQKQRQMHNSSSCTGSHGSHLSPADVCGLLSQCHVPRFRHQETIRPKRLPAFYLSLWRSVSEYIHLFFYSHLSAANTLTTGGQMKRKVFLRCCHLVG